MNVLGIDWGEKRIGLAFADSLAIAVPIEPAIQKKLKERLAHIEKEIKQRKVEAIAIGYPLNMDGTVGFKAKEVDVFIEKLENKSAYLSLLTICEARGSGFKESSSRILFSISSEIREWLPTAPLIFP